ncbi:DUF488 domain-containing protein [Flavobacterium sp. XN-5]|uniref:DUF488 domain-containing protein n=1 Tax=Flavobacterium sp. XN-5 TaxID=2599390 RepID=UPI00293BF2FD|nr:DUF488 domain-containing protein [Flavobacterium sp. XN-5]
MNTLKPTAIYTIGHSSHSLEVFLAMLHSFNTQIVVDIRKFHSSRKFSQFNQENLKLALETNGIQHLHMIDLGGKRKANKDSKNMRWNNESFRGYADYMEITAFEIAVDKLEEIALKKKHSIYVL